MTPRAALFAVLAWSAAVRADPGEPLAFHEQQSSSRLCIGGGVSRYLESSDLGLGGLWEVRLTFPAIRSWLRAEVAYVGTVHSANAGSAETAFTHSIETDGRLYFARSLGSFLVEPFVSGGFAYTFLVTSTTTAPGSGYALVPFGIGLTVIRDTLLLESRLTYRQGFHNHLITRADGTHASLTSWAATMALGCAF